MSFSFAAGAGLIAIDEHSVVSCLIGNITETSFGLTLLDATQVPSAFLLTIGSAFHVCRVVRRREEEIEACFADQPAPRRSLLRRDVAVH